MFTILFITTMINTSRILESKEGSDEKDQYDTKCVISNKTKKERILSSRNLESEEENELVQDEGDDDKEEIEFNFVCTQVLDEKKKKELNKELKVKIKESTEIEIVYQQKNKEKKYTPIFSEKVTVEKEFEK